MRYGAFKKKTGSKSLVLSGSIHESMKDGLHYGSWTNQTCQNSVLIHAHFIKRNSVSLKCDNINKPILT